MTGVVLDASVAVKLVSDEIGSDVALQRIEDADEIIAPDWVVLEVAHALWKKVSANQLDRSAAEAGIAGLMQIVDRLEISGDLLMDAVGLSYQLSHPVYDCLYLALANREDVALLTADEKFAAVLRRDRSSTPVLTL